MASYQYTAQEILQAEEQLSYSADIDTMERWRALIDEEWDVKTGGKKPFIRTVISEKYPDASNIDWVFIYPSGRALKPISLGYDYREIRNRQSVDIRTSISHARLQQLKREVDRIIMKNRVNYGATGYNVITSSTEHDLSDKMRKIYRYVIDYDCITYAEKIMI